MTTHVIMNPSRLLIEMCNLYTHGIIQTLMNVQLVFMCALEMQHAAMLMVVIFASACSTSLEMDTTVQVKIMLSLNMHNECCITHYKNWDENTRWK